MYLVLLYTLGDFEVSVDLTVKNQSSRSFNSAIRFQNQNTWNSKKQFFSDIQRCISWLVEHFKQIVLTLLPQPGFLQVAHFPEMSGK